MRSVIAAAFFVGLGTAAVFAQSANPIADRQAIMKGVAAAARTGTQMVRGEAPFELAKAQEVLRVFQKAGQDYPALFPANSNTGDTAASPAVWTDKAGFDAANAKFAADAAAALAKTTDLASFRTAFGDVARNCGACHQPYRINRQ